jgi:hypothetical protein
VSGKPQTDANDSNYLLRLRGFSRFGMEVSTSRSAPRTAYLQGTVAIMSPSQIHEGIKPGCRE